MKIDFPQIESLIRRLANSSVQVLEWGDGHTMLRLRRDGGCAGSPLESPADQGGSGAGVAPIDATAQPAPLPLEVTADAVGQWLDRAPFQPEPMVDIGSRVEVGQLVGLLQAGPILLPVRSAVSGVVATLLTRPGVQVEYQQAVLQLQTPRAADTEDRP
ncbi:acetyl-CoA carboxylase biotin carboxyl carrier protein [Frateuria aurantia]